MILSKHNIFSKLKNSDDYFIVNLLSQNADIFDLKIADGIKSGQFLNRDELIKKGYLVNEDDENKLFKQKYLDFLDNRDSDELQIFFVPRYSCNFNCSYCYQNEYTNQTSELSDEIIQAFFTYINKHFSGRQKYITLFGGEPLLPGEKYKQEFKRLIQYSNKHNLSLAIVTNGYSLVDYFDLIQTAKIREIQVTLDGTADIHNNRRSLKNGGPTFQAIVDGIDLLLKNKIPVNLRVVVDRENLAGLSDLAKLAINRGWTANNLFKTQLGRNYELHFCQSGTSKLYSRLEMYQDLYELIKRTPEIQEFHRPSFSIAKFLFENGELPDPLFDSCPGCKTEWAFDYTGRIFSCTATVGKENEILGTFYPEININEKSISEWEERDVNAITECRNCNLRLACGGGCAAVAKNKTGKLHAPDCRPIKELLEIGLDMYFNTQDK